MDKTILKGQIGPFCAINNKLIWTNWNSH